MKGFPLVIAAILLTGVCWGSYGPVLHWGQNAMPTANDRMRPFLCVGLAYFVIAVVVPMILLGGGALSPSTWTMKGFFWSSAAGVAGAVGALGIVIALTNGGKPSYVMPLVFGLAPVINSAFTLYFMGTWKDFQGEPMKLGFFLAGLILVAVGAVTVLVSTPKPKPHGKPAVAATAAPKAAAPQPVIESEKPAVSDKPEDANEV